MSLIRGHGVGVHQRYRWTVELESIRMAFDQTPTPGLLAELEWYYRKRSPRRRRLQNINSRSDLVRGGDFHRRTLLNAGEGHLLPALPVGRLRCKLSGESMTTSAITANGHTVLLGGVKIASTRYVSIWSLPMHRD